MKNTIFRLTCAKQHKRACPVIKPGKKAASGTVLLMSAITLGERNEEMQYIKDMKKCFIHTYSRIIAICCLINTLLGCSGTKPTSPEERARAAIVVEDAKLQFGEINTKIYKNYLYSISARLNDALERAGRGRLELNTYLLSTSEPLAYSPGAGTILLSRGLILRLNCEAELAFVMAHELGHLVYNHQSFSHTDSSSSYNLRLEEEADRFAAHLLAAAGYNPYYSRSGLIHAYGALSDEVGNPNSHISKRMEALLIEIDATGWTPPGTIDRRDFQKLRSILR